MIRKNQAGFTLIEMLIVVAVIGILSSVLLNALGPAKDKAKDARIIQEVNQVRALAETLYDGTYKNLETLPKAEIQNINLKSLADDITLQGGQLVIRKPSLNSYITYSKLNVMVGTADVPQINYYCVDATGRSGYTINDQALTNPRQGQCPFE